MSRDTPVVAIVGWKNSGKTGLVERLVGTAVRRGLRVSTAKHAHHAVDIDQPGRDSWRHREAGAHEVALVSASRFVLQRDLRGRAEPSLLEVAATLEPVDLIIAEGFKSSLAAKIEAWRPACEHAPLAAKDNSVFAIAVEGGASVLASRHPQLVKRLPVLELDDTEAILDAAFDHLKS